MTLDRGNRHLGNHFDIVLEAGGFMPLGDPALGIGVEDGDPIALVGEFGRKQQGGSGLAGSALGIGK
ncbi:hypothetical protein D3C72_2012850 [compost metagenome]